MFHVEQLGISAHLLTITRVRINFNPSTLAEGSRLPMKFRSSVLLLALLLLAPCTAFAGPRDADAVLNRCGKPLKGDDTVLDNSVAGGHRTLHYERGTLQFDRAQNTGWTFVSGSHKKAANLSADEMAKWMPCLPLALADSASPEPLQKVTEIQRVAVSMKHSYKALILWVLAGLIALGVIFYLLSLRKPEEEDGLVG